MEHIQLRKSYQSRLSVAVLSTVGLALILSLFLLSENSSAVFNPVHPGISIPDTKISNFHRLVQPANKKIVMQHAAIKSIPEVERPPLIVASDNINSLPATPAEIQPSFTGTGISGMNLAPDGDGPDKGSLNGNGATIKTKLPEPDKSIPVEVAEIMPQYPGGIPGASFFSEKKYSFTRQCRRG